MIRIKCSCGENYNFKDEMAGKRVICPKCGTAIEVSSDPFHYYFNRDKFLMKQKHWSFSEKYQICDEGENPILYVLRSRKWYKLIFGIIAGLTMYSMFITMMREIADSAFGKESHMANLINSAGTFVGVGIIGIIILSIYGKRNILFSENDDYSNCIIKVEQTNLFQFPVGEFRVLDNNGKLLAKLSKNHLCDIFRKRWKWHDEEGRLVAVIKEESIILSILRRLLGSFFGILRMNFVFKTPDNVTFGEFNRKVSITDKYILDLTVDRERIYDRKVCLALGVLLDTGERR